MKPSEIVNLEEGFKDTAVGNWLARKGAFGTKAAVTAQGAHMAKGQAELSKAAEGVLKAKLIQQLISGLENAVNSGIVSVPIPENKNSYNQYNFLIEKIILNEAMSVQDFAKQFINNLLSKYQITPDQKMQLDALTDDFQKAYKGPGKPIPEKEIQNLTDLIKKLCEIFQKNSEELSTNFIFSLEKNLKPLQKEINLSLIKHN